MQDHLQNPYQRYREQNIQTASPGKLIMMLFDGLVRFLRQAGDAIRNGRIEEAHNCLVRSQDIIRELDSSLNMEFEISGNLHAIYDFLYYQAVKANTDKDAAVVESCLGMVKELRGAWLQVVSNQGGSNSPASANTAK